jgi:hypothetical protein
MKIYDIIATEGLLGKVIGKAADMAAPSAEKITAKATAKAAKTAKFDADLKVLSTVFGDLTDKIIKISYAWGIGKPMIDTGMQIASLNRQLAAGQISQDQYDNDVRFYLGRCTTEILAIGAFNVALKAGAGIIKSVPFPGTTALGLLVNKMTPAASALYGAWLATPGPLGGQKIFTEWFVSESFSAGAARSIAGSLSGSLYNALVSKAKEITTGKTADTKTPEPETSVIPLDKSAIDNPLGQPAATGPAAVQRDYYTGARLN